MADRQLRYPLLWLIFGVTMAAGAGLMLSRDPARQMMGLGLLAAPIVVFSAVGLVYYARQRRSGRI